MMAKDVAFQHGMLGRQVLKIEPEHPGPLVALTPRGLRRMRTCNQVTGGWAEDSDLGCDLPAAARVAKPVQAMNMAQSHRRCGGVTGREIDP